MLNLIGKAYAQGGFVNPRLEFVRNLNFTNWTTSIVNWIMLVAGLIAVIYLIYGGILYITAGGDAEKATKGRTAVINAVIGIIIILLALVIVNWVSNFASTGSV